MASYEVYLTSALSKYHYAEQTKRELLLVFGSFSDLRPTIQKYVFNDNISKDLVCLDGTIPVPYKGKTYNIPICMWLMDTHPYNPPLVYVKPTSRMQIRPGRHVDETGRIYLPYLHEWKHPQSDILGTLEILKIVFGEEPPVFAKPASSPAQPPYPMTGASNPRLLYPTAEMAAGGVASTKVCDVTQCSICFETFKEPKALPCIHTFCLHCLDAYCGLTEEKKEVACPLCRKVFTIPPGGNVNLPSNYYVLQLLKVKQSTVAAEK